MTEGGAPGLGAGTKISGLLLDYVAPIGAFLAGFATKDAFGLWSVIDGFMPSALKSNSFISLSHLITAIVFFGIAYVAMRYIPMLGRTVAGLLAGMGVGVMAQGFKGPLAKMAPGS